MFTEKEIQNYIWSVRDNWADLVEPFIPPKSLVCKSLNISYEEWFETALKSSEFDVLVKFLDNPEDQTSWMWDEKLVNLLGVLRLNSTESTRPAHPQIGEGCTGLVKQN